MTPIVTITPRELELQAQVATLKQQLSDALDALEAKEKKQTDWPEWFRWLW